MNAYKSKDIDYMRKLKKAVLRGMRGHMPEDKTYTWEYVRKQVTLDDLQAYAIGELGKIVHFPTENYNAKIMIIFLQKPDGVELEIVERMMNAAKVKKEDVYITYLGKSETDTAEEGEVLEKVLDGEIRIINPELILSFGLNIHPQAHTVVDFKDRKCLVTYDMDYIIKENETPLKERKQALWDDIKQLLAHYKQ
jgi:hypothetical protein